MRYTMHKAMRYTMHMPRLIVARDGAGCDLNYIDVSGVTDFVDIFTKSPFNGKIEQWQSTSYVKNFPY